jgi:hypothetical protein
MTTAAEMFPRSWGTAPFFDVLLSLMQEIHSSSSAEGAVRIEEEGEQSQKIWCTYVSPSWALSSSP